MNNIVQFEPNLLNTSFNNFKIICIDKIRSNILMERDCKKPYLKLLNNFPIYLHHTANSPRVIENLKRLKIPLNSKFSRRLLSDNFTY